MNTTHPRCKKSSSTAGAGDRGADRAHLPALASLRRWFLPRSQVPLFPANLLTNCSPIACQQLANSFPVFAVAIAPCRLVLLLCSRQPPLFLVPFILLLLQTTDVVLPSFCRRAAFVLCDNLTSPSPNPIVLPHGANRSRRRSYLFLPLSVKPHVSRTTPTVSKYRCVCATHCSQREPFFALSFLELPFGPLLAPPPLSLVSCRSGGEGRSMRVGERRQRDSWM